MGGFKPVKRATSAGGLQNDADDASSPTLINTVFLSTYSCRSTWSQRSFRHQILLFTPIHGHA